MSLFGQDTPVSENGLSVNSDAPGVVSLSDLDAVARDVSALPDGFDPARHATNPDGTPKLRGDGTFALKRGRKPGQKSLGGAIVATPGATNKLTNEEAARQMFAFASGLAVGFIGEEWAPEDASEKKGMEAALCAYFDSKGQFDLPPEVGLAIAFGAYGAKRMKHENTRGKFRGAIRKAIGAVKWAWNSVARR